VSSVPVPLSVSPSLRWDIYSVVVVTRSTLVTPSISWAGILYDPDAVDVRIPILFPKVFGYLSA